MKSSVERAIECIWARYDEALTTSDLASSAMLSKYHFCRTFSQTIGVSPGRFLSAVRVYQAKRLLRNSAMNVTDISFAVGFNSLGSFTNHFTKSVGTSPGRYRRMAKGSDSELLVPPPAPPPSQGWAKRVNGKIILPRDHAIASVYVGVFRTAILQGWPQAATVLQFRSPGHWQTYGLQVPPGEWFVHAVAVADTIDPEPWTRRVQLAGKSGPILAADETSTSAVISLRPVSPMDPPILFALPELEQQLGRLAASRGPRCLLDASVSRPAESAAGLANAD